MNEGEFPDLTAAILRKTTGKVPICRKIEDRLCAWVDGELSGIDADLVAGHVAHCVECRSVTVALRAVAEVLPPLADIEPDVRFVLDVLDRTTRRKAARFDPVARLEGAWTRMIRRPRIAQEIAYCAAMVLFLVLGTHSRQENALREEGPALSVRAAGEFTRGVDLVSSLVFRAAEGIESGNRPRLPGEAGDVQGKLRRTGSRVARTWNLASACGARIGDALLRWDMVTVWMAIHDFRDGVRRCWKDAAPARPAPDAAPTDAAPVIGAAPVIDATPAPGATQAIDIAPATEPSRTPARIPSQARR